MNTANFSQFLDDISSEPLLVLDDSIPLNTYFPIDISKSNTDLKAFDTSLSLAWEAYLLKYLAKHNKQVAYGGYLEQRDLYDRSDYFKNLEAHLKRNIHLGTDLWCASYTKVLAVLDGEIHSFKNNKNHGDYGPTIILKHTHKEEIFYTLYGHLSIASIENIKVGDSVLQGSEIATLGEASVNGDYAPHLHFQIIKDLEGNFGDYPGVASEVNIQFYKKNCPNPNLLLKIV